MARSKRKWCLGCGSPFSATGINSIPACHKCRGNPRKFSQIVVKWKMRLSDNTIDVLAEAETASLPRKDAYTPMQGEAMILKMMRDQW